jgi:hypothetical protein
MKSSAANQSTLLRLDERNHVEKPFPDQLYGFGWEIIYNKKEPAAV